MDIDFNERGFCILTGDSLKRLGDVPDGSVDCCITSPPYFNLRDYHADGQIGVEKTPKEYIANLVDVFHEVKRVLKDDGTLWVNIGDSYCNSNGFSRKPEEWRRKGRDGAMANDRKLDALHSTGLKTKDLIGIPWMLAFALREDGWYLRQDIIWNKPNPLPESVLDRCTKAHEYIFLLSKQERYYFDYEAIEEEATGYDGRKDTLLKGSPKYADSELYFGSSSQTMAARGHQRWKFKEIFKPEMKNMQNMGRSIHSMHKNRAAGGKDTVYPVRRKRDVWTVPTKSYAGAHFATYPEKLIEPCILAGSRPGGVVLDVFNGAATTGVVALRHGRKYLGIELNPDYVVLSERRLDGREDGDGTEFLF